MGTYHPTVYIFLLSIRVVERVWTAVYEWVQKASFLAAGDETLYRDTVDQKLVLRYQKPVYRADSVVFNRNVVKISRRDGWGTRCPVVLT